VTAPSEVLDALMSTLAEERAAIRRFDTAAVERTASEKQRLADEISAMSTADLAPFSRKLLLLRAELRRNGVLLAHARTCVEEVLDVVRPRQGGARRGALRARL